MKLEKQSNGERRSPELQELLVRAADGELDEAGTLDFDVPGPKEAGAVGMVIPRSNPTNVIFRNNSDEHRRLSLDLGIQIVEVEHDGETEEVEAPHQICTTLIEPGGAQLLTVKAGEPSFAYDDIENPNGADGAGGFWFFVPGVDSAKLEVIVHQHLPIFHTEHCVFCRFLSDG